MNTLLDDFKLSFGDVRCLCKSELEGEDTKQLSRLDFKKMSQEIYGKILSRKKCSKEDCNNDGAIKKEDKFYCKKHAGDKLCYKCEKEGEKFLSYANEWVCRGCIKSAECTVPNTKIPKMDCDKKKKYLHESCKKWICQNHLKWYRLE